MSFDEFLNVALEFGQISSRAESVWDKKVSQQAQLFDDFAFTT